MDQKEKISFRSRAPVKNCFFPPQGSADQLEHLTDNSVIFKDTETCLVFLCFPNFGNRDKTICLISWVRGINNVVLKYYSLSLLHLIVPFTLYPRPAVGM